MLEQLVRALRRSLRTEVEEAAEHHEVLATAQDLVHRGVLADEADPLSDSPGVAHDVEPRDLRPSAVGQQQRRQDPDRRRLAGAVRSEEADDPPATHDEVEAVQRRGRSEALHEPFGNHRVRPRFHPHLLIIGTVYEVGRL